MMNPRVGLSEKSKSSSITNSDKTTAQIFRKFIPINCVASKRLGFSKSSRIVLLVRDSLVRKCSSSEGSSEKKAASLAEIIADPKSKLVMMISTTAISMVNGFITNAVTCKRCKQL